MCGIYGFSRAPGSTFDGARFLNDALSSQSHRGPDGVGVHIGEAAGVGMARLRVRAPLGEPQPIPMADAGYAAYNGEVYHNYLGRTPDGGAGEVDCLTSPSVDGMYSLLKINALGTTLEIQRDTYGIKPLFVRKHRGALAFSSEKQPLIQGLGKIRLRREAIAQYLAFGRPIDGLGFYEGLRSIPAGGRLSASGDTLVQASASRDIAQRITGATLRAPPCHEEVREAIRDAVGRTLVSNRKVGVAVSGGLDSTILCSELDSLGITDLDLISIQALGSQDGITDLSALELKGEAWKSWRLPASRFDPATYWRDLRRAIAILGEPTQMTSAPLYLGLAEKAAEAGVVVLLLGEGADELFCGYRSYLPMLSGWSLRDFLFRPLERAVCQRLFSGEIQARCAAALDVFTRALPEGDQWTQLRAAEMSHNLEPLLLRADHTLMRCSIEGRTPFLHGDVADLAFSLPIDSLLSPNQTKVFLRQAYFRDLPAHFSTEIKKPFRAPVATWFVGPLKAWLTEEFSRQEAVFACLGIEPGGLEHVLTKTAQGHARMAKVAFCLLTLGFWIDWLMENDLIDEPDIARAHRMGNEGPAKR